MSPLWGLENEASDRLSHLSKVTWEPHAGSWQDSGIRLQISSKQPVAERTLSPRNTGNKTGGEMITTWDDNMSYLCILKLKGRTWFISFYYLPF